MSGLQTAVRLLHAGARSAKARALYAHALDLGEVDAGTVRALAGQLLELERAGEVTASELQAALDVAARLGVQGGAGDGGRG